jgi:hypothetical protein
MPDCEKMWIVLRYKNILIIGVSRIVSIPSNVYNWHKLRHLNLFALEYSGKCGLSRDEIKYTNIRLFRVVSVPSNSRNLRRFNLLALECSATATVLDFINEWLVVIVLTKNKNILQHEKTYRADCAAKNRIISQWNELIKTCK